MKMEKEIKRRVLHGKALTTEYTIWRGIKMRCLNPKNPAYKYYGGRGITICDEWVDNFLKFLEDMGSRPSKYHSIDRRENNLGYSKDNCYWATKLEQSKNRKYTVWVLYKGEIITQHELALKFGVGDGAILHHKKQGKTFEQIISHYEALQLK